MQNSDNRSAILSFFFLRRLSHSAFNSHFPKEEKFSALPLLPACRTNQERIQILHITCCKLRRGNTKQHNPLPSSICSSGESSVNADNYNKCRQYHAVKIRFKVKHDSPVFFLLTILMRPTVRTHVYR